MQEDITVVKSNVIMRIHSAAQDSLVSPPSICLHRNMWLHRWCTSGGELRTILWKGAYFRLMNYRISDEMLALSTSLVCMKFCRQSKEQVHMFAILHRTTSIKRVADNKPTTSGRLNAASRKRQAQQKTVEVMTEHTHLAHVLYTLRYRLTCLCT